MRRADRAIEHAFRAYSTKLARHAQVHHPLSVAGAAGGDDALTFAPRDFIDRDLTPLTRPTILTIESSHVLAAALHKRSNGDVDAKGRPLEGPTRRLVGSCN